MSGYCLFLLFVIGMFIFLISSSFFYIAANVDKFVKVFNPELDAWFFAAIGGLLVFAGICIFAGIFLRRKEKRVQINRI